MMHTIKKLNFLNIENFNKFFNNLPPDPYLEGNYRFRRLSRFKVHCDELTKLPYEHFFQSKHYNTLLGAVKRDYPELDEEIVKLDSFKEVVSEFVNACKLNLRQEIKINVHQFRIVCSFNNCGEPVPEGIHRDAVDFVGIFCVRRENIQGGETHLYKSKKGDPVFRKILAPGELLVFDDQEFFHFTTPIKPLLDDVGIRDVFVLTFPIREKAPAPQLSANATQD